MKYKEFEFFASPTDGQERTSEDASKEVFKEYFCEIYHEADEGLANLLACFTLQEGKDIPVNSEDALIATLQAYVDDHYLELSAACPKPEKRDYLHEFLHQTDFDLLYQQKRALLEAREYDQKVPEEVLSGLIHLLDLVGDWAEQEGLFKYPEPDQRTTVAEEIMHLARKHLNESGTVIYPFPDQQCFLAIVVAPPSKESMDHKDPFYTLKLLQKTRNGNCEHFTGCAGYNDFKKLMECCEHALDRYEALQKTRKAPLDQKISEANAQSSTKAPFNDKDLSR